MSRRSGFTLVELLVTVTIIGLLASMLLFGLVKVQAQTQAAKTKATIAKIHSLLSERWETYSSRRVPINTINVSPKDAAELRLVALRQIQRMEMPDHWAEVTTAPAELKKISGSNTGVTLTRTALSEAYLRAYNTMSVGKTSDNKPSAQQQDAECLYMILTIGATEDRNGRELFMDSEIGDVDNDGAPEFLDGWGKPIRYIRWPVGFIDDPRQDASAQARFGHLSDLMPPKSTASAAAPLTPCKPDAINKHDVFDPRKVDSEAFYIFPLVYSGGPDKIVDIYGGPSTQVRDDPYVDFRTDTTPCGAYDPLASFTVGTASVGLPKLLGIPHDLDVFWYQTQLPGNNKLNHYDNIHNHQMDASFR